MCSYAVLSERFACQFSLQVSDGTAPLEVGKLLGDYSILALELNDKCGIEEELKAVRKIGVPVHQQVAYVAKLAVNKKAVLQSNPLVGHVAALSVSISPEDESHPALVDTWLAIVKNMNMDCGEQGISSDISRIVIETCRKWNLKNPIQGMVEECEVLAKNDNKAPRVYKVSGWLARHASSLLDPPSLLKLLRIVTPRRAFAEDWKPRVKELDSLKLALPDFVRALIALKDFQSNVTVKRYLEDILQIYIPIPEWLRKDYSHPLGFLLAGGDVQEQVRAVVIVKLRKIAEKGKELQKTWVITSRVLQFIEFTAKSRAVNQQVIEHFFPLFLDLVSIDISLRQSVQNLLIQSLNQDLNLILEMLKEHVVKELHKDPSRNFALLRAFTKIDIRLGQNMIRPVIQEVNRIEKQRGGFPDQKLKKNLDDFENTVYGDKRLGRS